ncbi:molybdenum cofactor biosynthesis protein B [Alcaligenes faecalis subsp. faecalis NCIB 8687]|jgi:molybdenum cofactor biosynthesis protein B|nr:molybdenum cofactor biosynthesis protein B [Alcaligenes faecalis subsp. faecalis NCIB 8687]
MSKAKTDRPAARLNAAVLTISDRRGPDEDSSGDYLASSLSESGHHCVQRAISKDNIYAIRAILSQWIADPDIHVILCNGGTGFSHKKSTIAAVTPLLDQVITGFGEQFRYLSYQDIGSSALQSDALAGTANRTLIFCLPGSGGACALAWENILKEQLDSRHRPCNFASQYLEPHSP